MRYLSFTIKNYKGIKKATLDLEGKMEPGIYTLVGLNESGKTTILDAIKHLRDGTDTAAINATSLIPRRERSSFSDVVEVSAELKLNQKDKENLEKVILKFPYKNVTVHDKLIFTRLYHYEKSKYSGEEAINHIQILASKKNSSKDPEGLTRDKHPDLFEAIDNFINKSLPPVVYYSDFLYNFPSKIYIDKESATKPIQKFYRSVLEDILASLEIDLTLDELATRIKSPKKEDEGQVSTVISQMQFRVTTEVFGRWNEIFGTSYENQKINFEPGVDSDDAENPSCAYIKVSLIDGPDDFLITEKSLGFKWFFSFLLLTIFRKSRQEGQEEILYLLDEPASNLHPTAQKKILETIKKLGEGNSKLIYTTHSHFLINPKWLEGAFIIKNLALDSSRYGDSRATEIDIIKYRIFAANHPDQKEYFQPILDTLDYQPSNLEMVEPLIIAEGKFDYYTLTYLKQHYFSDYEYLNIYPGGGAGSNSEAIALYLAWTKSFCVLHDADYAGKAAKTKYLNRFGDVLLLDRCITYADIDSSWDGKKTEALFNQGDLLKIQKTLYPDENNYKKDYFNEAIQKLLIDNVKVELGTQTVNRFKKVFEKIGSKLPNDV